MIKTYTYNTLTWVDVESPTRDEIVELIKQYDLRPLVGEDLLSTGTRPKFEEHDDYVYLVLHIPVRTHIDGEYIVSKKELDFILGKDFIITVKYDVIDPLVNFSKSFETNAILDNKSLGEHAGFVFYYIMKKLYTHMALDMENIRMALEVAEEAIFNESEKEMVVVLSSLSRELIDLREASRFHKEALAGVHTVAQSMFGDGFKGYIADIMKEHAKVNELAESNREFLNDLRETNNSLLSTKQNEIMKTLTIGAFITFPLSLLTSIFSINAADTPIISGPHGFEVILGIMIVLSGIMVLYFKHRKWL